MRRAGKLKLQAAKLMREQYRGERYRGSAGGLFLMRRSVRQMTASAMSASGSQPISRQRGTRKLSGCSPMATVHHRSFNGQPRSHCYPARAECVMRPSMMVPSFRTGGRRPWPKVVEESNLPWHATSVNACSSAVVSSQPVQVGDESNKASLLPGVRICQEGTGSAAAALSHSVCFFMRSSFGASAVASAWKHLISTDG